MGKGRLANDGTAAPARTKAGRRVREPQWVAFGELLRSILEKRMLTTSQFCALLNDAGCDADQTILSKVLTGAIPPPERAISGIRHLATVKAGKRGQQRTEEDPRSLPMIMRAESKPWADVLHLAGDERERFIEAAWVARSPSPIMEIIAKLRSRLK